MQAAQSIITAVCTDAHDKQEVLDALLRPRPGWPHYAAAPAAEQDGGAEAAEAGCGGAEEFGKQPAAGTSGRAGTFSELAYALGCELGFNSITYDNDGRNRCSTSGCKCIKAQQLWFCNPPHMMYCKRGILNLEIRCRYVHGSSIAINRAMMYQVSP